MGLLDNRLGDTLSYSVINNVYKKHKWFSNVILLGVLMVLFEINSNNEVGNTYEAAASKTFKWYSSIENFRIDSIQYY